MKVLESLEKTEASEIGRGLFWRLLGGAALLSVVAYGWIVVHGYFFSDDFTWLWFGQRIVENPAQLWTLKAGSFFSPVMNAYYSILLSLFGPSAPAYYIVNLLVHVGVATLAGLLAFRLSRSHVAAWIALVFVVLAGCAYEPLIWIGANMHSFVTLFILLALYGYWRHLETRKTPWLVMSIVGQLLAYGTKETSIVVAPLLALLYLNWRFFRKERTNWKHWIFVGATLLGSAVYAGLQLILQDSGKTFSANQYQIAWPGLWRYPFVLADLFIPILPFRTYFTPSSAALAGLVFVALFGFVLWYWRKVSGVLFAAGIMLVGALPPLFFVPRNWWEPLASRYQYLPRMGAALMVALIFAHLVRGNASRWKIFIFGAVVCFGVVAQLGFMVQTVRVDYAYIYRSGRTLAVSIKKMEKTSETRVLVHPPFPFGQNRAHIIGALVVFGKIKEENVIFLAESDRPTLDAMHQLLYWYPKKRTYETTNDSSIYKRFPLP